MLRRSFVLAATLAAATAIVPARASADEAPPAATASSLPTDTVILRSGAMYRGSLAEIVPGDHVTLVLVGGEQKTIPWTDVDRISAGAEIPALPPPPPPATPAPSAETPARLEAPPPEPPPRYEWRANRPLLVAGAIGFAAGWGPNVAAAAPSTVSLAGRVVLFVASLGLFLVLCGISEGGDDWLCHAHHGGMQLLVPIAGPFLFAENHPRDSILNKEGSPLNDTTKGLLYASAGLQIAGVGAILAAVATGKKELVPGRTKSRTSPSFMIAPIDAPNAVGLSLSVARW